jgi:hypothetical protein
MTGIEANVARALELDVHGNPDSEPSARASAELFAQLRSGAEQVSELAAAHGCTEGDAAKAVSADVMALLGSTLSTLSELERAVASPVPDDFSAGEQETWVGLRPQQAEPSRIEDVCFVAGFELKRALRAVADAGDAEASAVASETALRKLQRVLCAVLESAEQSGFSTLDTAPLRRRLGAELASALAVRQLYARFRRTLRRPEDDSRDAVLTALRYAAGGLAVIAASPHYHAVRLSDRALLRQLRDRLLDWAHAGKPTEAGVQLLDDIFTCADLLRDINRRQELSAHDTDLIRELVGDTERGREAWLAKLERLTGLDDELDALTVELRGAPDLGPVIEIIVRLSVLVG